MFKNILFIHSFCFVSLFVRGNETDSLNKLIQDFRFPETDTSAGFSDLLAADTSLLFTITDVCRKLGNHYLKNNQYEEALSVYRGQSMILKALDRKLPEKGLYKKELITTYNRAGATSLFLSDYENARKFFLNALDYFFRLNLVQQKNIETRAGLFNVYVNLGKIYLYIDDFPMALTYYLKALEISESLKDYYGSNTVCNQLGMLYRIQKKYDSAISWLTRGMKISEVLGSQKEPADAYFHLGETFFFKREVTSARSYFAKSNRIWKAQLDKRQNDSLAATRLLNGYMNIIFCLDDTTSEKSITPFFNETNTILPFVKDKKALSIYYERKSYLAGIRGDDKNEIIYMKKALNYAEETSEGNIVLSHIQKLIQLSEKFKYSKETNYYKKKFTICRDSLSVIQSKLSVKKKEIKASIKQEAEEEKKIIALSKAVEAEEQVKLNRLKRIGYFFLLSLVVFGMYLLKKRKKHSS